MGLGMVREQVVFIHITCDAVESLGQGWMIQVLSKYLKVYSLTFSNTRSNFITINKCHQ